MKYAAVILLTATSVKANFSWGRCQSFLDIGMPHVPMTFDAVDYEIPANTYAAGYPPELRFSIWEETSRSRTVPDWGAMMADCVTAEFKVDVENSVLTQTTQDWRWYNPLFLTETVKKSLWKPDRSIGYVNWNGWDTLAYGAEGVPLSNGKPNTYAIDWNSEHITLYTCVDAWNGWGKEEYMWNYKIHSKAEAEREEIGQAAYEEMIIRDFKDQAEMFDEDVSYGAWNFIKDYMGQMQLTYQGETCEYNTHAHP